MPTKEEIIAARQRAKEALKGPIATAARYDEATGRIVVSLSTGFDISFRPQDAQGTDTATPEQLRNVEVSPNGLGIHFDDADAHLSIPGILSGIMGTRNWMAAHIGRAGGTAKSAAKSAAVKANGAKGGRPRKQAATAV